MVIFIYHSAEIVVSPKSRFYLNLFMVMKIAGLTKYYSHAPLGSQAEPKTNLSLARISFKAADE
jgi:hypothetical protein